MIRPYKTFCVEPSPARRHRRQLYLYPVHMDITIRVLIRTGVGVRLHSGWNLIMDTELQLQEGLEIMAWK
jgi:hypothetical protein